MVEDKVEFCKTFLSEIKDGPTKSKEEIQEFFEAASSIIGKRTSHWRLRIELLQNIVKIVLQFYEKENREQVIQLNELLEIVDPSVSAALNDLRSVVVKETSLCICNLAEVLKKDYEAHAIFLLPQLIRCTSQTVAPIHRAATQAVKKLIENCDLKNGLHIFEANIKTKNKRLKIGATSLLLYLLEHQGENVIEESPMLGNIILCAITDANGIVRQNARACLEKIRLLNEQVAENILNRIPKERRSVANQQKTRQSQRRKLVDEASIKKPWKRRKKVKKPEVIVLSDTDTNAPPPPIMQQIKSKKDIQTLIKEIKISAEQKQQPNGEFLNEIKSALKENLQSKKINSHRDWLILFRQCLSLSPNFLDTSDGLLLINMVTNLVESKKYYQHCKNIGNLMKPKGITQEMIMILKKMNGNEEAFLRILILHTYIITHENIQHIDLAEYLQILSSFPPTIANDELKCCMTQLIQQLIRVVSPSILFNSIAKQSSKLLLLVDLNNVCVQNLLTTCCDDFQTIYQSHKSLKKIYRVECGVPIFPFVSAEPCRNQDFTCLDDIGLLEITILILNRAFPEEYVPEILERTLSMMYEGQYFKHAFMLLQACCWVFPENINAICGECIQHLGKCFTSDVAEDIRVWASEIICEFSLAVSPQVCLAKLLVILDQIDENHISTGHFRILDRMLIRLKREEVNTYVSSFARLMEKCYYEFGRRESIRTMAVASLCGIDVLNELEEDSFLKNVVEIGISEKHFDGWVSSMRRILIN